MEKTYQPQLFEKKLYEFWSKGGYFGAKPNPEKEPFTIVMPPPNITGQLHMGHALDETVQDIIIRFKRMSGYEALWIPGTDHASIATEVKIVDKLKAEGLDKREIGREEFLRRAWEWKKQYGGRIVEQLKTLGSSCDWSREAFTMDENLSAAVLEVFCKLYDKGLIYRGDRIINWCPTCGTALSDAEVEYSEKDSFLWHFRYPLKDGSGYIEVATTRPETIPGDTAVAVNPKDPKYKHLVGKILVLPVNGREIPIVADNYVEMGFGSGAVKITPAHDPNDFEVGLRHNLPVIRVMDDNGVMNELAGKYNGLTRDECRKQIVEDLKEGGFLVKIEPYKHNVGECYRCSTIVEPIVSKQWFVKMKPLAEPAVAAVKKRKVEFIPKRFEKTYFNWMENVRDWCISRQLWWGHRIPAYYCDDCGEMTVSKTKVEVCPKCGGKHVRQDEDVLDTWFSSALWPFSTLGYPKKTKDLEYFYPTNVLVTAYDIIFFWVARMIFSGIENMGEVPFSEVLIHGLVRDSQGRKMSKSLGNGIDPLEIIDKYGADTLRFSLATGIAPGSDTRYSEEKVESCRNFMNKLWNASRFLIMNMEGKELKDISELKKLPVDKWILTKLQGLIKEVTINLNKYEIGLAAGKIYDFVWSDFCDWYIEMEKPLLYGDNEKLKIHALSMLSYVLETVLKLLHPFVPFVTEEIFRILHPDKALIVEEWPKYNKRLTYYAEAKAFEGVMNLIKAVRNIRAEMNVAPSKRVTLLIKDNEHRPFFEKTAMFIEKLAGASHVEFVKEKPTDVKVSTAVSDSVEVYIPLGELVDTEKEILRAEGMLGNQKFVANAPKALVEKERDKLEKYRQKRDKLSEQIENLK